MQKIVTLVTGVMRIQGYLSDYSDFPDIDKSYPDFSISVINISTPFSI